MNGSLLRLSSDDNFPRSWALLNIFYSDAKINDQWLYHRTTRGKKSAKRPEAPVLNVRLLQHCWSFPSPCPPRRLRPRPQSDEECWVESEGKPRFPPMMPMLIFSQSPFTPPTTVLVSTTPYSDVFWVPFAPLWQASTSSWGCDNTTQEITSKRSGNSNF